MSAPAGSSPAEGDRRAADDRGGSAAAHGAGAPGDGGPSEPPPVLRSWGRLYALVVLELVVVILALYWLTRRFA